MNQSTLHEVLMASDGAIAEVCHRQGPICSGYASDLANSIVTYVFTGMIRSTDRFNPMRSQDFADENVRQATMIILDHVRPMCNSRGRVSRLARISTYTNQPQVA